MRNGINKNIGKQPDHILDQIITNKLNEVELAKSKTSIGTLRAMIDTIEPAKDFHAAFSDKIPTSKIIAECKRKSPSKGELCRAYDPEQIASMYEKNGASAISVLTDENYFGGTLEHLALIRSCVDIPVLRKDFIVDEFQIYEARRFGADSFLLIAGTMDSVKLQFFIEIGRELGMEPLVEVHSVDDLKLALRTDAKIIGINNRDLRTMRVDKNHSAKLLDEITKDDTPRTLIYESGVSQREDIERAEKQGFKGFLVGELLMTSSDPGRELQKLIGKQ